MKRLKMVHPNTSTLDPRVTAENFGFAFDDSDLSDRVLHIEVAEDSLDSKFDNENLTTEFCCMHLLIHEPSGHQSLHLLCTKNPIDFFVDEEGDAIGSHGSDCSVVVKVIDIHISSPIVAAKSPFFYKLFKNGMRESLQKDLTLRITSSEEASLMDILKFMYNNTLSATTVGDLLDVLVVADKFEVVSCMRYCIEVLQEMPMSLESALLYLELPSCVLDSEVVQPLMHATKQYLAARYRNINKSREEVMSLPLAAIEAVLGSNGLKVFSEDTIFDLVLNWARKHYPELEERRDILSNRLSHLVHFRNMTTWKLKQVLLDCPDFNYEQLSKLVFDALYLKAEGYIYPQTERVYVCQPIKVMRHGLSRLSCAVYFELKKQDCADLSQSRYIVSEIFCLGGQGFSLLPHCWKDPQSLLDYFGLSVIVNKGSAQHRFSAELSGQGFSLHPHCWSFTSDYEVEVMKKPSGVFVSQHRFSAALIRVPYVATVFRLGMFGIEWKEFMADESEYFIDGILHLRVNVTIKPSSD